MNLKQENREAGITTPLGADKVVLRSLQGREELGRLFRFDLELLSEDPAIRFEDIIGNSVTVWLRLPEDKKRYFSGFVSQFTQLAPMNRYPRYRAVIVPWLWFLTRSADCQTFQKKTVPEIIEDVFKKHSFDAYTLKLTGSYDPREYCVQYRETAFDFVSRLMEEEGIYYFFIHEDGKHTLVLADGASAHQPFDGYADIGYRPPDDTGKSGEHIRDWIVNKEVLTGKYAHTDYNFEMPQTDLEARSEIPRDHAKADLEKFDYPGEYQKYNLGDRYARVRIEEIQAGHETLQGEGNARGLCVGYRFKLADHPRQDQNRENGYVVCSTTLNIQEDLFEAGPGGGVPPKFFQCSFAAMDATAQFRPARITPRPTVKGPQTAVVVGPKGEEIHTDKYGRVKVMFHWDRYAKADENSSCWIRVAQSWAGKKWGAIYTPRIGQEVIVEFLEGDPDQPIITGRVYNAEVMPPYELPGKGTISTLKSNSSKGGAGFNEIRFEDKKGEEQIFVHGEKNLDIRIKNDAFEWIGNNTHLIVKKDQFAHVENNRDETVDADHKEKIGKDRHLKVVGKEAKAVDGSLSLTVKGDVIEVFKANHSEQTTSDYYLKADNVCIEAMTNLTLKVGQTTLAMEAGGLGIKTTGQVKIESTGPMEIKATGPLKVESAATADLKSATTSVKGDAMVIVQGGMVKIN